MTPAVVFILVFLLVLFLRAVIPKRRPAKFPPGPQGLPLLGNAHQVGLTGHKRAMQLASIYGDVIGLRFGTHWMVVLNNPDDIREAFAMPEFSWKAGFNSFTRDNIEDGAYGVIMNHGKSWVEHRRFTLRTLRDFGFGKQTMEQVIMREVRDVVGRLSECCGKPIQTSETFNAAIINVTWSIVAGKRHDFGHPELVELIRLLHAFIEKGFTGFQMLYFLFPGLVTLRTKFPFLFPDGKVELFRKKVLTFLQDTIEEHRKSFNEDNIRDFTDMYLRQVKRTKERDSSLHPDNTGGDADLISLLLEFFIAGSETSSTTLTWSLFLLALHPESQDKLYREIQSVLGDEKREIVLADRPQLPYAEATIAEVMRVSSVLPFGATHATSEDVEFRGYVIPKGTLILANLYSTHHAPELWGDPENFRPERFLATGANGKTCVRGHKAWMPFGTGRRVCIGETAAKAEVFLFLANIVKTFRITMPTDEPAHSLEGIPGGLLTPEPHRIVLQLRGYGERNLVKN